MMKFKLSTIIVPMVFISIFTLIGFSSVALNRSNNAEQSLQQQLSMLEQAYGGHLGLYAINTANNISYQYHGESRFPFCSTFKVIVVSAILKRSMLDPHFLQQKINYNKTDIVGYSPVTAKHVSDGMSVYALATAALTQSDNAASNLLMKLLGGPSSITAFAQSIGDNTFRLDRWEPALNSAIPGDIRDTTTPKAMAISLQKLALENVLASSQQTQLQRWLKANLTGNNRIRAGVPAGWIVGDKTGTGDYGTTNDIGIIWPPHGAPIVLVIYYTQAQKDAPPREKIIADATRILINAYT